MTEVTDKHSEMSITNVLIPLGNSVVLPEDVTQLGSRVLLLRLGQAALGPLVKKVAPLLGITSLQYVIKSSYFLTSQFQSPKIEAEHIDESGEHYIEGNKLDELDELAESAIHSCRHAIMAIMFTKPVDLVIRPVLIFQGSLDNPGTTSVRQMECHWPGTVTGEIFNEDDLETFISLLDTINQISVKRRSKLHSAINFFWQAQGTIYFDPAFILYLTALEALLLTGGVELSHKLSERVAYLMGNDYRDRIELYNSVREAYDVRSSLAHGERPTLSTEHIERLMFSTAKTVRDCIRKVLLSAGLTNIFGSSGKRAAKIVELFFKNLVLGASETEAVEHALEGID